MRHIGQPHDARHVTLTVYLFHKQINDLSTISYLNLFRLYEQMCHLCLSKLSQIFKKNSTDTTITIMTTL